MNPANNPAPGEPGNGDITTIWSEATHLFKDTGERRDFAPGAAARSMPALREQRKNCEFCDVVFLPRAGSEVWAHRFVVAARYSGCYTLFALAKEGLSPEEKWLPPMRIVVKDLGSDMIGLLIDIAYHIPLLELVGQHNIGEVLDLAEMLQLSHLLNHCVNFLKRDNQPESCIDNYHLVSSHGYNHLANEAFRYLLRNFDQSLTRNSLPVGEVASIDLSHKMWLTPRIPKHIIFVFGGWTDGATNVMSTYNYRAAKWRLIGNQYTSPRSYHGVVVINQCIYVVGGFNGRECYHSVVCYEVPLGRWSAKANMTHARCYVSVAFLEGHIYAMGGYDGTWRIKTAERYDVKKNNWTEIANMHETGSDASTATTCGRLYMYGISDSSRHDGAAIAMLHERLHGPLGPRFRGVLRSIHQHLDPSATHALATQWPQVVSVQGSNIHNWRLQRRRTRFYLAAVRPARKINTSSCPTCPTPKATSPQQSWKALYIYVIGGFNGTTIVSLVERYDIESHKWFMVPEMPTRMSACSAAVTEDVANPDAWI
ncbi:uncharacterized protein LOC119170255 [Rhipicephalus microplus]|uniref:uncharacterized protein LOC119170255 n=1 Tax=Rhipicephalus microplus TaxID=6941 RepID=UPI003F6D3F12